MVLHAVRAHNGAREGYNSPLPSRTYDGWWGRRHALADLDLRPVCAGGDGVILSHLPAFFTADSGLIGPDSGLSEAMALSLCAILPQSNAVTSTALSLDLRRWKRSFRLLTQGGGVTLCRAI